MIKISYYKCETTNLLESALELFVRTRNGNHNSLSNDEVMGLNYNIIINSACILEGKLESILSNIIEYFQDVFMHIEIDSKHDHRIVYGFINKTISNFKTQASRTTGIKNYSVFIHNLVTDYTITEEMKELNEGIIVLFELRNVLAHGRMITAETRTNMPYPEYNELGVQEKFNGGYKKAEDYLLKKGIIGTKFLDSNGEQFFQNCVADHFYEISQKYLTALISGLPNDIKSFIQKTPMTK